MIDENVKWIILKIVCTIYIVYVAILIDKKLRKRNKRRIAKQKTKKWFGKLPINSRIFISYEGKTPTVKFVYPTKFQTVGSIGIMICSLLITCGIYFFVSGLVPLGQWTLLAYLILIYGTYFIMQKILELFFTKTIYGTKFYPSFNKFFLDENWSATFKPKDVKDLKCEIPLFYNVYMDYDAYGEMGDYLSRVKIIEHDFKQIKRKGRKRIKKKNVYLWKTVFHFKKLPKNGKLEVRFT